MSVVGTRCPVWFLGRIFVRVSDAAFIVACGLPPGAGPAPRQGRKRAHPPDDCIINTVKGVTYQSLSACSCAPDAHNQSKMSGLTGSASITGLARSALTDSSAAALIRASSRARCSSSGVISCGSLVVPAPSLPNVRS